MKTILHKRWLLYALWPALCLQVYGQGVVINEIMPSNAFTLADEDGDYSDWIELYNPGEAPINLQGIYLSDDATNLFRWSLPSYVLEPNAFLVIFASGKNRPLSPPYHTNFSIAASGEALYLSDVNGFVLDSFPEIDLPGDHSFGRQTDGGTALVQFDQSTPGASNVSGSIWQAFEESLEFSHPSGLYSLGFELQITASNPNHTIRYTLNGSDPHQESEVYDDAVQIIDRTPLPNGISMIPTNAPGTYISLGWQAPLGQVFKATALKAQLFNGEAPSSPVYCANYFVSQDIHNRYPGMPMVAILTDSLHLFDYHTGIYVPGIVHDTTTTLDPALGFGNYNMTGMQWEIPVHVTIIEPNGTVGLSQNLGMRIHGGGTRQLPIKSLRLHARNLYGHPEIAYNFFPWKQVEGYERILLRNSGNDWRRTYFTDGLTAMLCSDMNIEVQDFRPAVVFINGEFWGIHNFRDRVDTRFLAYTAQISPDHIDIVENWNYAAEGSADDFLDLMTYVASHPLSESPHYELVSSRIDIDNFIDYYIARQYSGVFDWPGNNVTCWRSNEPPGKWRWILRDSDGSFQNPAGNAVTNATTTNSSVWSTSEEDVLLFNSLLSNESFLASYLQRFAHHLNVSFAPDRVHHYIDSLEAIFAPVMPEHVNRWRWPGSMAAWEAEINVLRNFANHRPCNLVSQLIQAYGSVHVPIFEGICDTIATSSQNVSDREALPLWLWPNPSSGQLSVRHQEIGSATQVSIKDLQGRVVYQNVLSIQSGSVSTLNVAHLPNGIYLIEIGEAGSWRRGKFVVTK